MARFLSLGWAKFSTRPATGDTSCSTSPTAPILNEVTIGTVADAFDAMVHERPYRAERPVEEGIAEIRPVSRQPVQSRRCGCACAPAPAWRAPGSGERPSDGSFSTATLTPHDGGTVGGSLCAVPTLRERSDDLLVEAFVDITLPRSLGHHDDLSHANVGVPFNDFANVRWGTDW